MEQIWTNRMSEQSIHYFATKYKFADEKNESIDDKYLNKFEDMKESYYSIIEDNMSLFLSGFEWLKRR